jgi:hypothetical protein
MENARRTSGLISSICRTLQAAKQAAGAFLKKQIFHFSFAIAEDLLVPIRVFSWIVRQPQPNRRSTKKHETAPNTIAKVFICSALVLRWRMTN